MQVGSWNIEQSRLLQLGISILMSLYPGVFKNIALSCYIRCFGHDVFSKFSIKKGVGLAKSKISSTEKNLGIQIARGGGGVSLVWIFSEKNPVFFMYLSIFKLLDASVSVG